MWWSFVTNHEVTLWIYNYIQITTLPLHQQQQDDNNNNNNNNILSAIGTAILQSWKMLYQQGVLVSTMAMYGIVGPILWFSLFRVILLDQRIGPLRKALSTILCLTLFPIAYPILALSLVQLLWVILSTLILLLFVYIGPVVFAWVVLGQYLIWDSSQKYLLQQQTKNNFNNNKNQQRHDISILEFILALIVAPLSFITTGTIVLIITITRSPLLLSSMYPMSLKWFGKKIKKYYKHIRRNRDCLGLFWLALLCLLFIITMITTLPIIIFLIISSIVIKVIAATLWPAYVTCGWIRSLSIKRQQYHKQKIIKNKQQQSNNKTNLHHSSNDFWAQQYPEILILSKGKLKTATTISTVSSNSSCMDSTNNNSDSGNSSSCSSPTEATQLLNSANNNSDECTVISSSDIAKVASILQQQGQQQQHTSNYDDGNEDTEKAKQYSCPNPILLFQAIGSILQDASIAAYQVIYVCDLLSSAASNCWFQPNLTFTALKQFQEIIKGQRFGFSQQVRTLSYLSHPKMLSVSSSLLDHVTTNKNNNDNNNKLYWTVDLDTLAEVYFDHFQDKNTARVLVESVWNGFWNQAQIVKHQAIHTRQWLSTEYILECPAPLITGITSIVLLKCCIRSLIDDSCVLSDELLIDAGFKVPTTTIDSYNDYNNSLQLFQLFIPIGSHNRPKNSILVDEIWNLLLQTKQICMELLVEQCHLSSSDLFQWSQNPFCVSKFIQKHQKEKKRRQNRHKSKLFEKDSTKTTTKTTTTMKHDDEDADYYCYNNNNPWKELERLVAILLASGEQLQNLPKPLQEYFLNENCIDYKFGEINYYHDNNNNPAVFGHHHAEYYYKIINNITKASLMIIKQHEYKQQMVQTLLLQE